MKKLLSFSLIAMLFVLSSATDVLASGYVPQWKVGDRWVLEASYRDKLNDIEGWTPSVEWMFRVRAIRKINDEQCYVVHVFPRKPGLKVQAVLWLSVENLQPLRVIDIYPTPEGAGYSRRDYDPKYPEPLSAPDSMIPYDMPVFPLVKADTSVQGADGFDAYRTEPEAAKYDRISQVGGLSFRRAVGQKNRNPQRQYSDAFSAYRGGGEKFQVEVSDARSGETMTQLWQEGSPWAISVETADVKVKLLQPSDPTPLPQSPQGGRR